MATKTLNTRITLKADTTANWSNSTLVLLKGEMAIEIPESGEYKMKIGDGVNTFGKLSYVAMTPTEIKALISSGAVQTVSLSTGTNNGTIAITVDGVKTDNIAVKGLGSAAYTNSGAYATAGHGHSISGITGLQTALDGKAAAGHTHDDRYYTETEMNTKLAGKANSSHSHGAGDISSVNASAIQGVIGLDHLPAGALERCKIVKDDTARFALTKTAVQTGDTVKVTDTGKMYFIVDDSKLSTEAGYEVYTAGSATSVPWSGVTGKPSTFTPSSHTHNYAGSSSAGGSANWANGASYANYANKIACNPTEDKSTNGLFMFQYNENTTICPDSAWWSVVRTQHPGYNNGYWQEMAYRFDSDIIKFRRNVNGSKSAWKTIAFTDSKVSSAGYADSAGSANSVAWGNVSGRPSSMPASDVYSWAKASSKPSYTKAEVGLGNVDNTADANKSVRYAASAGSATTATNATNANYLNMVANNEIRFNKPSWTTKNDLWIGYKWADSPGADLINAYHFGNGNGGYASIAAASVDVTNVNAAEYVNIGQPNNSNNGAIELYGVSPYIDFHAGGTNTDYTSRIIAYSDRIEFVFA